MTEEETTTPTYPIEKQDYTIDTTENDQISITITNNNYTVRNKDNKKIRNNTNGISILDPKWKQTSIITLTGAVLPTTTINMTSNNNITLQFTDPSEATVEVSMPLNMKTIETSIAEQINPIYSRDIGVLVDLAQAFLFQVYTDEDVLYLIDNTVPETTTTAEETTSSGDNTGGDNTETTTTETNDNTGGDNTGGDNTGEDNTGGDNTETTNP